MPEKFLQISQVECLTRADRRLFFLDTTLGPAAKKRLRRLHHSTLEYHTLHVMDFNLNSKERQMRKHILTKEKLTRSQGKVSCL